MQLTGWIVPASAIIFNQNGMKVVAVEKWHRAPAHIESTPITVIEVEVNSGIKNGDQVTL